MSFSVSIVIPHKVEDPLNIPTHDSGDEVLVIEGLGAGEARVKGAQDARNAWLLQCDADGFYPPIYVARAKQLIGEGLYPIGFKAHRIGGFVSERRQEAGLVVKRDLFLERTADFDPAGKRVDVGEFFTDLPVDRSLVYFHPLTWGEGQVATSLVCLAAGGVLLLAVRP